MKTHLPRLFLAHPPAEERQALEPVNPKERKVEGVEAGLPRVNKFGFTLSVRHELIPRTSAEPRKKQCWWCMKEKLKTAVCGLMVHHNLLQQILRKELGKKKKKKKVI